MTLTELVFYVLIALVLGTLIGAERQWRQRMAGLRTNTLVCVGSALFVSIAALTADEISPTRVAAQVVSGIGFLGAGVIFKEGVNVRGLNTAATLWCSAAVGALVGSGFIGPAVIGTGAVLVANMALRPVARGINRQPQESVETEVCYRLNVTCHGEDENHVRKLIFDASTRQALLLRGLFSEDVDGNGKARVWADLTTTGRRDRLMERLISQLGLEKGVTAISWQVVPSQDDDNQTRNLFGRISRSEADA